MSVRRKVYPGSLDGLRRCGCYSKKKSSLLSTHVQISLRSTCTTAMVALVEGLCSMIKIQDSVDVRGLAKFLLFKGEIRLFSNNIVVAMATKLHLASEFTL